MQPSTTDSKAMIREVDDLLNAVAASMEEVKRSMDESGSEVSVEMIEAEVKAEQAREEAKRLSESPVSEAPAVETTAVDSDDASGLLEGSDANAVENDTEAEKVANARTDTLTDTQPQTHPEPNTTSADAAMLNDQGETASIPTEAPEQASSASDDQGTASASSEVDSNGRGERKDHEGQAPADIMDDAALAELDEAIAGSAEAALDEDESSDAPTASVSEVSRTEEETVATPGDSESEIKEIEGSTDSAVEPVASAPETPPAESAVVNTASDLPPADVSPQDQTAHRPCEVMQSEPADDPWLSGGFFPRLVPLMRRLWSVVPCGDRASRIVWQACVRLNRPWHTWSRETQMMISLVATFTGLLGFLAVVIALTRML